MQQLGYHYVNLDASWNLKNRSATGELQPDPALWPHGIDYTIDHVHRRELGFGLYGDRGSYDCAEHPGAFNHTSIDAAFLAKHKVDFYKEDSCYASGDRNVAFAEYAKMRDALNATGRRIWFALCGWEPWYAVPPQGGNRIGNSARIGPDTGGGWQSVLTNIRNALSVSEYAGPSPNRAGGYWNDGSLMLTPNYNRDWTKVITPDRHRTQFSAWCLLAMNILTTGNLSALDPYVIETWTNSEMLDINQDPLGVAGRALNVTRVPMTSTGLNYARVAECGGEPEDQIWNWNDPVPGFVRNPKTNTCLNVADCRNKVIYDACELDSTTCGASKPPLIHPNEQFNIHTNGTVMSDLPGAPCLSANSDGSVSVSVCTNSKGQKWQYVTNGTLKEGGGRCLTTGAISPPSPPPGGIGRPLSDNRFALMLINHESSRQVVSCDRACLSSLGLTPEKQYIARDVWAHADLPESINASGALSVILNANGTSAVYILREKDID